MHPESSISLSNETAAHRWSLLRLPIVFRHPESLEFPRRTDQRHFRFYKNAAINGETFATGTGRSGMGRRPAPEASRAAACLQRNAQRNAQTDGPAARVYP